GFSGVVGRATEREHPSSVGGCRDLMAELLDDPADLLDLLCVAGGELSLSDPQAVLQADSDVPAQQSAVRGEGELIPSGGECRELVLVAEELIGDGDHVREVRVICADAAEDAEHALDEQRRLGQALVHEVREVVKVADVVALVLESGVALLTELAERVLDLVEGVDEWM